MPLIRHRGRTFLLYKETGMQKLARTLVETGKAFVDPSAIMIQMREDSDFWSLPPLTILCWRTLSVITKNPEDEPGPAQNEQHHNQIDYILVRKRFLSGVNSAKTRSVFQEQTLEVTTACWWWLSTFFWKRISKPKHTRLKFDPQKTQNKEEIKRTLFSWTKQDKRGSPLFQATYNIKTEKNKPSVQLILCQLDVGGWRKEKGTRLTVSH